MNTDNLTKLYDRLTPRERLPLIMAASMRGDNVEKQRLVESAAKVFQAMPDYVPLAKAYIQAEKLFLLTVLDLAAKFWCWWGLWMTTARSSQPTRRLRRDRHAEAMFAKDVRRHSLTRYHAYRLVTHVDAWMQFCAERDCDPHAILQYEASWQTVTFAERNARDVAFTVEECREFLVADDLKEGEVLPEVMPRRPEMVPGLVKEWHIILDDLLTQEGG